MKLLLDTHTFLWLVEGDKSLSAKAQNEICNANNSVFLSTISVWELAIKTSRAVPQLSLKVPLDEYIRKWIEAYRIQILPIELAHIFKLAELPKLHADPFDRLLICQAQSESMILVSADQKLAAYPLSLLW